MSAIGSSHLGNHNLYHCYIYPMTNTRRYSQELNRLREAGLLPTRQRLALAQMLLDGENRHVTAEQLYNEARAKGIRVVLASVYNILHKFTEAGLLRQVVVDPTRSYFDTNISDHHHFFAEATGELQDIPGHMVKVTSLPEVPEGTEIERVEVIIRIRSSSQ